MAITKVGTYRNPPEDITDYEAIVAHLEAYTRQVGNQGMILTEWTNTTTAPKIAMGSYISHGGVLYVVEDEDYSLPALSVNGTYYIRVAVSGATLVITYTTNIADYSWNAVYGGLYHADESQVLGYQIIKAGVAVGKYKILNPWQGSSDFTVVDYLGHLHGTSLCISGAASIGGALGVTGAITDKNSNNIITPTHLNITIDASSAPVTVYMPDMEIGEIKIIKATLITGGTGKRAALLHPATGKYIREGITREAYISAGAEFAANETSGPSTRVFYGFTMRIE